MTAATATPHKHSTVLFLSGHDGFTPKWNFKRGDNGQRVMSVTDVPVFRSGTFRDSLGVQRTWEPIHMTQMADNFGLLASRGTFAKVPVRRGHGALFSDPMDNLIGWHTGVTTKEMKSPIDGNTYSYLVVDFDLFDPEAQERVANGDWPNRSAEVGTFVTNAETEFWPAYMGFAYVDIPAVEGLNFSAYTKDPSNAVSILFDKPKEFGVTAPATETTTQPGTPAAPSAPALPTPPAASGSQPAEPSGQAPAAHAAPAAAPQAAPAFSFRVNGVETTDLVAVQNHITTLEGFQAETVKSGRADFVKSLAEGPTPKIMQSQVESLTELAQGMDSDQFAKFKTSYEGLPANPLFANHGQQNNGPAGGQPSGGAPTKTPDQERYEIVSEMVAQHRRAGKTDAQIEKLPSFQEMKQLEKKLATAGVQV